MRQMERQGSGAIVNNASAGALTDNPATGTYVCPDRAGPPPTLTLVELAAALAPYRNRGAITDDKEDPSCIKKTVRNRLEDELGWF